MAQQVERFTRNEQVGGSNPPTSSKRPKRDKRSGLFRFLFFFCKNSVNLCHFPTLAIFSSLFFKNVGLTFPRFIYKIKVIFNKEIF